MTAVMDAIIAGGKAGFKQFTVNGKVTGWRIGCGECNAGYSANWGPMQPINDMIRAMNRKGWSVDFGRIPVCAGCVAKRKEMQAMAEKDQREPTENAVISKKVHTLLMSQFDDATGAYLAGYSDERVAKEADCSPEFVKKTRRGAYGELKEDPRLTQLKAELQALAAKCQRLIAELDARRSA